MQKAFFIEEEPSKNSIDENDVVAKYAGKYSEYDIKPSKNMPGFYLVKDKVKDRDSSDLINSKIQKIIFSDCVKSFDEIVKNATKISEKNIVSDLKDIILKRSHRKVFSIQESKICDNKIKYDRDQNNNISKFNPNKQSDKTKISLNLKSSECDINLDTKKNIFDKLNKKPFGKSVIIDSNIINSLIIHINGYDEKNDKIIFDILKIPMSVDYRYAISKNTLEIKILGFLNLQNARELMDSFEYKFANFGNKNIKVSINEVVVYNEFF